MCLYYTLLQQFDLGLYLTGNVRMFQFNLSRGYCGGVPTAVQVRRTCPMGTNLWSPHFWCRFRDYGFVYFVDSCVCLL